MEETPRPSYNVWDASMPSLGSPLSLHFSSWEDSGVPHPCPEARKRLCCPWTLLGAAGAAEGAPWCGRRWREAVSRGAFICGWEVPSNISFSQIIWWLLCDSHTVLPLALRVVTHHLNVADDVLLLFYFFLFIFFAIECAIDLEKPIKIWSNNYTNASQVHTCSRN